MKVLLWLLQEIGVPKVPSFDALKKIQKKIKEEHIVPTTQWMSPKGNAFSFNDPRAIIANVSVFRQESQIQLTDYCLKGLGQSFSRKAYTAISSPPKHWHCFRNLAWQKVASWLGPPSSKSDVWWRWWKTLLYWWTDQAGRWPSCYSSPLVGRWRRAGLVRGLGNQEGRNSALVQGTPIIHADDNIVKGTFCCLWREDYSVASFRFAWKSPWSWRLEFLT